MGAEADNDSWSKALCQTTSHLYNSKSLPSRHCSSNGHLALFKVHYVTGGAQWGICSCTIVLVQQKFRDACDCTDVAGWQFHLCQVPCNHSRVALHTGHTEDIPPVGNTMVLPEPDTAAAAPAATPEVKMVPVPVLANVKAPRLPATAMVPALHC